jgi:lipooligosaccharide transport system permease protein
MSTPTIPTLPLRVVPPGTASRLLRSRRSRFLIERNVRVYRSAWAMLISGIFEPVFYLFSIGVGVSKLVGDVQVSGHLVSYTAFIAPAMLASSAMNGSMADAIFNLFFKLKYLKMYDAVLATPMTPFDIAVGEIGWALMRGSFYSSVFLAVMLVMGLVSSWWALLALPAAVLIGFAFAAVGAAAPTYMRSWQDFEYVNLFALPMFLFSATFYPLSTYPTWLQHVVVFSPLYHCAALLRSLTTGAVGPSALVHVGVLLALGVTGVVVAGRRLETLLNP